MHSNYRSNLWGTLACWALIISGALPAASQKGQNLQVNSCFPDILRNESNLEDRTALKYSLLSLWSRDMYDAAKMNSAMETAYGAGNLDLSQEKVTRELQTRNESIDYNRATAYQVAWLDSQAKDIIIHCLDKMKAVYGASTAIRNEDQRYLDVTIYWTGTTGEPLIIKKQEIFNGNVLDQAGTHRAVPIESSSRWSDPEIRSGSFKTIRIERTGPYQTVILKFQVSPDIGFEDIIVPPVPEKVQYEKIAVTVDPKTLQQRTKIWDQDDSVEAQGLKLGTVEPYKHHWAMYHNVSELTDDPSAVFTSITCEKWAPFGDLDHAQPPWAARVVLPAGTSDATCSGWWQNQGQRITMTVTWQTTGLKPIPQTWQSWYPPPSTSKGQ